MIRTHYNRARRKGIIKPPEKCEQCHKVGLLHGHHRDYTKQLDVIWLCPSCHGKARKEASRYRPTMTAYFRKLTGLDRKNTQISFSYERKVEISFAELLQHPEFIKKQIEIFTDSEQCLFSGPAECQ